MMRSKQSQAGFSILELMISLLLGLVIIAGIVQLFVGNSRTYEIVTAQSRLQENARYSFDFITQAARDAGYFGCAPEDDFVINGLVGNWNQIPEYDLSRPLDGFDANGDGTYTPTDLLTLPRTEGATNLNVHIAGNGIDGTTLTPAADVVLFRSVEQPVARLNAVLQSDAEPEVFTPGGEPEFEVNDVVVVSDCEQAAMFNVTGVAVAGDVTTLSRADGTGFFDNTTSVTTLGGDTLPAANPPPLSVLGRSYGGATTVGRVQTTIFFIAPSAIANEAGDNINALWRKVGSAAPVELVQGVEDMQVFYGVDTTNDGAANVNRYLTIDNVADINSVVAVRVRLDITSPDAILRQDGTRDRLRRTFSKTISIRNAGV